MLVLRQSASTEQKSNGVPNSTDENQPGQAWSGDIASLLLHELSPAVGWIRLAADLEISEYASSATERAVSKLQRRIDGLVALIKQSSELAMSEIDLVGLIRESWPDAASEPRIEPLVEKNSSSLIIVTDETLLGVILGNAFQNALDAERESGGTGRVVTTWGHTSQRFWIQISNPFAGAHIRQSLVSIEGSTSKSGHIGHGLSIMATAARLLDMTFKLEGTSGTATLIIEGPIRK